MKFRLLGEKDGDIWLAGEHDVRDVWAVLSREAIEDDSDLPQTNLTAEQCKLIADANIGVLSSYLRQLVEGPLLVSAKLPERLQVGIRSGDLRAAGFRLSTSILRQWPMTWVDAKSGRACP